MNKTIERVKRANASVPFLIAILAFTFGAALSFVTATTLPAALYEITHGWLAGQEAWSAVEGTFAAAFNGMPASLLANSLLALVLLVGLWLHYGASRKGGSDVSTFGLSLVKLVTVIHAVFFVLSLLLVAAAALFICMGVYAVLESAGEGRLIYPVIGTAGVLLLVVLIGVIFYYRGVLRTIKAVRMTLSTGVIMGKISGYVIAVNYILAAVFLAGAIFSPVIAGLITGALQAVGFVFLSIAMSHLRSEMTYIARRGGEGISRPE